MTTSYEPVFLVQTKMDNKTMKIAADNGMNPEQFCRAAIRFFSAQCVHTPKSKRASSTRPVKRSVSGRRTKG